MKRTVTVTLFALGAIVIAAMGARVSAQTAEPAAPAAPTMAPYLDHATADDCEIFVEIGKSKLNWTATEPPKYALVPESQEYSDEHKSNIGKLPPDRRYISDCSWQDFGVTPPAIATRDTRQSFNFDRPVYSGALARATLTILIVTPESGARLTLRSTNDLCTLEKRDNHWQLTTCKSIPGFYVNHLQ